MIMNGKRLLQLAPILNMESAKKSQHGISYGLTEVGYDIRLAHDIWLHGLKKFSLATSMETFDMPPNLVGRVSNKSTLARLGIDAAFSTVIEPGWRGTLVVEIVYHKFKPIRLRKGIGICTVIFEEINEDAYYNGKYQDQVGLTKARFADYN